MARGASVVVADQCLGAGRRAGANGAGARSGALGRSRRCRCAQLPGAVGEVDAERGRLDLAFSNTSIGVGGPTEELSLEHCERMLDVNAGHRRR